MTSHRVACYTDSRHALARFTHAIPPRCLRSTRRGARECNPRATTRTRGIQINHVDTESAQPINPALKVTALTDHHRAKAKLAHQPAAIPAGRERRNHNKVAITALAAGVAEGVGFTVHRGIALLHAAVVSRADELAGGIEDRGADGDAAFRQAGARFLERDGEHRRVIKWSCHGHFILAVALP